MSLDYPNRAEWLAKRSNPVAGKTYHGRMIWSSRRQGTYERKKHGPIGREAERRGR